MLFADCLRFLPFIRDRARTALLLLGLASGLAAAQDASANEVPSDALTKAVAAVVAGADDPHPHKLWASLHDALRKAPRIPDSLRSLLPLARTIASDPTRAGDAGAEILECSIWLPGSAGPEGLILRDLILHAMTLATASGEMEDRASACNHLSNGLHDCSEDLKVPAAFVPAAWLALHEELDEQRLPAAAMALIAMLADPALQKQQHNENLYNQAIGLFATNADVPGPWTAPASAAAFAFAQGHPDNTWIQDIYVQWLGKWPYPAAPGSGPLALAAFKKPSQTTTYHILRELTSVAADPATADGIIDLLIANPTLVAKSTQVGGDLELFPRLRPTSAGLRRWVLAALAALDDPTEKPPGLILAQALAMRREAPTEALPPEDQQRLRAAIDRDTDRRLLAVQLTVVLDPDVDVPDRLRALADPVFIAQSKDASFHSRRVLSPFLALDHLPLSGTACTAALVGNHDYDYDCLWLLYRQTGTDPAAMPNWAQQQLRGLTPDQFSILDKAAANINELLGVIAGFPRWKGASAFLSAHLDVVTDDQLVKLAQAIGTRPDAAAFAEVMRQPIIARRRQLGAAPRQTDWSNICNSADERIDLAKAMDRICGDRDLAKTWLAQDQATFFTDLIALACTDPDHPNVVAAREQWRLLAPNRPALAFADWLVTLESGANPGPFPTRAYRYLDDDKIGNACEMTMAADPQRLIPYLNDLRDPRALLIDSPLIDVVIRVMQASAQATTSSSTTTASAPTATGAAGTP